MPLLRLVRRRCEDETSAPACWYATFAAVARRGTDLPAAGERDVWGGSGFHESGSLGGGQLAGSTSSRHARSATQMLCTPCPRLTLFSFLRHAPRKHVVAQACHLPETLSLLVLLFSAAPASGVRETLSLAVTARVGSSEGKPALRYPIRRRKTHCAQRKGWRPGEKGCSTSSVVVQLSPSPFHRLDFARPADALKPCAIPGSLRFVACSQLRMTMTIMTTSS